MTVSQMFSQSAILTILGMAVVFSFLVIMIFAMHLMHAILRRVKPDIDKAPGPAPAAPAAPGDKGAVVAAISAALKEHNSL